MRKLTVLAMATIAIGFSASTALAGGWGHGPSFGTGGSANAQIDFQNYDCGCGDSSFSDTKTAKSKSSYKKTHSGLTVGTSSRSTVDISSSGTNFSGSNGVSAWSGISGGTFQGPPMAN